VGPWGGQDGPARHENDILFPSRQLVPVAAEGFPEAALGPGALHGIADLATGHDAQA
jgi:hypothetical protein